MKHGSRNEERSECDNGSICGVCFKIFRKNLAFIHNQLTNQDVQNYISTYEYFKEWLNEYKELILQEKFQQKLRTFNIGEWSKRKRKGFFKK